MLIALHAIQTMIRLPDPELGWSSFDDPFDLVVNEHKLLICFDLPGDFLMRRRAARVGKAETDNLP